MVSSISRRSFWRFLFSSSLALHLPSESFLIYERVFSWAYVRDLNDFSYSVVWSICSFLRLWTSLISFTFMVFLSLNRLLSSSVSRLSFSYSDYRFSNSVFSLAFSSCSFFSLLVRECWYDSCFFFSWSLRESLLRSSSRLFFSCWFSWLSASIFSTESICFLSRSSYSF